MRWRHLWQYRVLRWQEKTVSLKKLRNYILRIFLCGHYIFQSKSYQLLRETSFSSSCVWHVSCLVWVFNSTSFLWNYKIRNYSIYRTIVYVSVIWLTVILSSLYKNRYTENCLRKIAPYHNPNPRGNLLDENLQDNFTGSNFWQIFIKKHAFKEVLSFF